VSLKKLSEQIHKIVESNKIDECEYLSVGPKDLKTLDATLRLVPKLLALKEVAAFFVSDIVYKAPEQLASVLPFHVERFKAALAALDAGEGVGKVPNTDTPNEYPGGWPKYEG